MDTVSEGSEGTGATAEGMGAATVVLGTKAESAEGAGAGAGVCGTASANEESCEDCTYPTLFGEAQVFNVEASDVRGGASFRAAVCLLPRA